VKKGGRVISEESGSGGERALDASKEMEKTPPVVWP
jgi:hypothetical protein